MGGQDPQRDTILQALETLLEWPEIARSPQLSKFLDYIVRKTLDGEEQAIKAYSIAVDVFGRGADFDPQADPIVRVQARRLRGLLDDFYRGPGADAPIRIRLPVGRYVPDFPAADSGMALVIAPPEEGEVEAAKWRTAAGPPRLWYALAGLGILLVVAAYAITTWGPRPASVPIASGVMDRPSVSIVEFQDLSGTQDMPPQVAGLAIELVTDLEQFENVDVSYRGVAPVNEAQDSPIGDFVLAGIVRSDGAAVEYSAILTDTRSGSVVWNQTLAVTSGEAVDAGVLDTVSKDFTMVLGSPRGPLHAEARRLMAGAPPDIDINLYLCRVLFDRYRESVSSADAQAAQACLGALPETEKQNPVALAASAILSVEYVGPIPDEQGMADRYRLAQEQLTHAIDLNSTSGFVWEQQARLHEAEGRMDLAQGDYASAVQLNPANTDALAAFARRMALAGRLREAEPVALEALESAPNPPAWYFGVPTLLALRDGSNALAVEYAERYAQADRELGPILAIMAAQRSGVSGIVNRYLPQVLDTAAFRAKGVLPRLRARIADEALVDDIRSSLTEAGVPWVTLTRPH